MSQQPEIRYFTVEEANRALRVIQPLVAKLLEIRADLLDKRPEVWPVIQKALGNGVSRTASQVVQDFNRVEALVKEIEATGAVVKEINLGLVDFPAVRDGKVVYLCWQYGEPQILYWHDLDAGFAGRQPL